MASESNFVQLSIPKFDGHYDHWSMLMENFLRSKEYWSLVENGIPATILHKDTENGIWDSLKQKYQGTTRVKRAQLQALCKEFEVLHMKVGELVNEYFSRTLTIANKMRIHGEKIGDIAVIEKILRSMIPKFDYVVCFIEESNDLDVLSIDELQSSLLVHEQRMNCHIVEEQALKITYEDHSGGRGRGHGGFRGRGRQNFDKSTVECYYCHDLRHFQYECPKKETKANYEEASEEMLLMAYVEDVKEVNKEELWFLDSGCSNHMCGKKELFSVFDGGFRESVKLGNNSNMAVMGKGNVQLQVNGIMQVITGVFYVPDLKNNLLSIGQLQEKGLAILIQHGKCKIYHPERGLIMEIIWTFKLQWLENLSVKEDGAWLPQLTAPSTVCKNCLVGKQQRDPFPKKST
ncbi:hypothetical protein EZV62_019111 [Acer yangbiense]|uniref:Retrovirus-related Pol polyprotein from transposon TNT 1-94-like beta-barrel domain-containing protein n=1 Tax=Acer yangbiense TaxID=1000413 RepID=A0A5C7HBD1_9ROSI|nr:hypothetical protein EZV62_019111 [Acer yangbiense]